MVASVASSNDEVDKLLVEQQEEMED